MHITFRNEQLFHISDYPWADPSARMAGSMQAGSRCSPCSRCAPPRRAPCPSGGAPARLAHGRRAEVAGACGVARGGASGATGEAACWRVRMQRPGRGTREATGVQAETLRCSAQSLGSNAWRRRSRAGAGPPAWERRAKSCARAIKLDPADAAARFCSSPLRLLGTTSLSECCIFRGPGIPAGWSPLFFA